MSVRGVVAVMLTVLSAGSASAQSAADELGRATALMQQADQSFRRPMMNPRSDEAYRQLGDSISLFVHAAPGVRVDDALEAVQKIYEGRHLPMPSTLPAVAEDCGKRRDPALAHSLAMILWLKFSLARENAEADAKYGPLPDNPTFYAALQPPETAIELLANLKWSLDHDAPVREDFFATSALRKVFGVDAAPQRFLNGNVSSFAVVRSGGQFCSYLANRYIKAAGKANGVIDIQCTYRRDGMPSFADVEQVFGKQWVNGRMMRPPSPNAPPPPPATALHGNQTIAYDFSGAGVKRALGVSFAPDAAFAQLHMTVEEQ